MTPRDLIFFTLAILIAGLIGYLIADRLCPRNFPRWLVWAFAPVTGLGICSLIVFFFRRPMTTVDAMLLTVLLLFWFRSHRKSSFAEYRDISSWRAPIEQTLSHDIRHPGERPMAARSAAVERESRDPSRSTC